MKFKTYPFDVADYLTNDEIRSYYLTDALESHDVKIIMNALHTIARSKGGITQLSRVTGLTREGLHRALGDDCNPEFATVVKVLKALGVKLTASIGKKGSAASRQTNAKRRKPPAQAATSIKRKAA